MNDVLGRLIALANAPGLIGEVPRETKAEPSA
jgi:hypothetical protein